MTALAWNELLVIVLASLTLITVITKTVIDIRIYNKMMETLESVNRNFNLMTTIRKEIQNIIEKEE